MRHYTLRDEDLQKGQGARLTRRRVRLPGVLAGDAA